MNKVLEKCGFSTPAEVKEAIISANVKAARPAVPRRVESDGTDLFQPTHRGVYSYCRGGSWKPKHSPTY